MKFYKYQALGNDYILIEDIKEKTSSLKYARLAKKLCQRNFSIGADGLLILKYSKKADYRMEIYNQDGSKAKMCGNGLRCLSMHVFCTKKKNKNLIIETDTGQIDVIIHKMKKDTSYITISMKKEEYEIKKTTLTVDGKKIGLYLVSTGNSHAILFSDDIDTFNLDDLYKKIKRKKIFSKEINLSIVTYESKKSIKQRVYERGVGETLSCGTGAVAAAYVSLKTGKVKGTITVKQPGGELKVEEDKDKIFLSGFAEKVYEGEMKFFD